MRASLTAIAAYAAHPVRAAACLTLALAFALAAAPAQAADGMRWPGHTITYHETPTNLGVRDAAKAWNRSGVRIRFKRVASRSRADVLVKVGPKGCAGFAQLGYAPGRQALMSVLDCPRHDQMLVSAHEFGHILGLAHETRACALMNPVLFNGAPDQCKPPGGGLYRCRVFERHDLRRAARKYGGKPRVKRKSNCALFGRPPALAGFAANAPDAYQMDVQVKLGPKPKPRADTMSAVYGPQMNLQVAQAPGECPADPATLFTNPAYESYIADWGETSDVFLNPLGGPQCIAARIVDGKRAGPVSSTTVTPPAEPPPPDYGEPPPDEEPPPDA